MKFAEREKDILKGIHGVVINENGPTIVLSKVPTHMLKEVIDLCRNKEWLSLKIELSDITRLEEQGIELNRGEFNAYLNCQTIKEASPSFLAKHGIREILVGANEDPIEERMEYIKYGLIYTRLANLVSDIDMNMPEVERFKAVYTRLARMIDYDEGMEDCDSKYAKDNIKASRNMINAVLLNKTVCLGFAETLKQTLSLVGIEVKIAHSLRNNDDTRHAYNLVKIDGVWYNADLTWDYSSIRRGIRPKYCLKSDRHFIRCDMSIRPNHRPDNKAMKMPRCHESLEIYPELQEIPGFVVRINKKLKRTLQVINGNKKLQTNPATIMDFRKHIRTDEFSKPVQSNSTGQGGKHFSGKSKKTEKSDEDITK